MDSQHGQATVEWVGLVLLVALALAGVVALVPAGDGRSLGGALVHALVCAVRGGCAGDSRSGDAALVAAYGARDAELLRRYAPNIAYEPGTYTLPIDWRHCRSHRCSDAPDRAGLDVHSSARGRLPATAFTRVVRRGGETFLQYWLYYPDSTTTWGGAARAWRALTRRRYPGFHRDDWESYGVRIDSAGRAFARASSHHGYQYCKGGAPGCAGAWGPWTGWTRVSRGSHAGHIPMEIDRDERSTTAAALRLIPLEPIDPRTYRSQRRGGPTPPWLKEVYANPLSDSTD